MFFLLWLVVSCQGAGNRLEEDAAQAVPAPITAYLGIPDADVGLLGDRLPGVAAAVPQLERCAESRRNLLERARERVEEFLDVDDVPVHGEPATGDLVIGNLELDESLKADGVERRSARLIDEQVPGNSVQPTPWVVDPLALPYRPQPARDRLLSDLIRESRVASSVVVGGAELSPVSDQFVVWVHPLSAELAARMRTTFPDSATPFLAMRTPGENGPVGPPNSDKEYRAARN